jgi:preprotein translocase subunit YajC
MNVGPLIFLAALAAVIWFLLVRPQRQRQSAHRELIANLATGEEVVTAGGMLGTVRSIADGYVMLEIAPGTEVRIAKEAVTGVIRKDEEKVEEPASEAENGG